MSVEGLVDEEEEVEEAVDEEEEDEEEEDEKAVVENAHIMVMIHLFRNSSSTATSILSNSSSIYSINSPLIICNNLHSKIIIG
jgi:hypothetical protein